MPRRIDKTECAGCGICQKVCITGCITEGEDRKRMIMEPGCVDCGACQLACPIKCISHQNNLL
jgi:MinD superfamily P-loop ATPase